MTGQPARSRLKRLGQLRVLAIEPGQRTLDSQQNSAQHSSAQEQEANKQRNQP